MTKFTKYDLIVLPEERDFVPPADAPIMHRTTNELSVALEARLRAYNGFGMDLLEHFGNRNVAIAWIINHSDDLPSAKKWLGDTEWVFAASVEGALTKNIYYVDAPGRHHHVTRGMARDQPGEERFKSKQGFVVYKAGVVRHVNRKTAMAIAVANGQLWRWTSPTGYQGDDLFSEDLW